MTRALTTADLELLIMIAAGRLDFCEESAEQYDDQERAAEARKLRRVLGKLRRLGGAPIPYWPTELGADCGRLSLEDALAEAEKGAPELASAERAEQDADQ